MYRKNGATQFLRFPPTRRQSCAHRGPVSAAICSRVMGGCSFFLWCSARPKFVSSNCLGCRASFPPDALPRNSRLILPCYLFFFSIGACWCFGIANFLYAQGRTYRRKNDNKKRGLTPTFFFNACFLIVYFIISPFF